jgi:hypothetical protein
MRTGRGDLPRLLRDVETGRVAAPAQDVVVLLQEAVQEDAPGLRELATARGWSMFFVPIRDETTSRKSKVKRQLTLDLRVSVSSASSHAAER